jgi:hypothetical protein
VVKIQTVIFWVKALCCILVGGYRHPRETYTLHIHGRSLKMAACSSSKTLVSTYQAAIQCCILEDHSMEIYHDVQFHIYVQYVTRVWRLLCPVPKSLVINMNFRVVQ